MRPVLFISRKIETILDSFRKEFYTRFVHFEEN